MLFLNEIGYSITVVYLIHVLSSLYQFNFQRLYVFTHEVVYVGETFAKVNNEHIASCSYSKCTHACCLIVSAVSRPLLNLLIIHMVFCQLEILLGTFFNIYMGVVMNVKGRFPCILSNTLLMNLFYLCVGHYILNTSHCSVIAIYNVLLLYTPLALLHVLYPL